MMTALTEELLARAEQVYLMRLAREAGVVTRYHKDGGIPVGWTGFSAEVTKWLT